MRTITSLQAEAPARRSPLELLLHWLCRLSVPPLFIGIALSIGLTAAGGWLAVRLSRSYYAIAPYHYDSAFYRMQAVLFHRTLASQGIAATLWQSLQTKDSLDLSLRILLAQNFLLNPYGHMAVLLPFMSGFILLVIWYVFSHTRSWLLSIAVVAFLFTFPLMYNPIGGIADYWKDSLATWLLGSAAVTWLLSNTLERPRWSFLCGLLLGLLVLQRPASAVYGAMLFLPLFLWAAYRSIRLNGFRGGLIRIGAFVAPAVVLGTFLVITQWQKLYWYYFVFGYSYGSPLVVARSIVARLREGVGLALIVLIGIYLLCLVSIAGWRQRWGDIVVAAWLVCGLPLLVTITSALYFGFDILWSVLFIVLLATLVPRTLNTAHTRVFALVMIVTAVFTSTLQYHVVSNRFLSYAESIANKRRFYQELTRIITVQPEPQKFALVFNSVDDIFLNQVFFDTGVLLGRSVAFISIHDTYYSANFGNATAQQVVDTNIQALEKNTGTLAVAYCEPNDILQQPDFKGSPFSSQVAIMVNDHLLRSSHWKALNKLDSPYGCLYVYQYSTQALTETQKWQSLAFHKSLLEVALALPLASGVRSYGYTSRYQPEEVNGIYYQWLPSGKGGLHLTLFSDKARTVIFRAHAVPGPDRKDALRTLVVSDAGQETALRVDGEQDIQVQLDLQPGLNQVDLYVQEPADNKAQNRADTRELMLLLGSPRLVSDSD